MVVDDIGNVDCILCVDTGGDSLYSADPQDQAKATPDQDLTSLLAVSKLNENIAKYSAIVACGIDSPDNDFEKLQFANAKFIRLSNNQIDQVLEQYERWDFTGKNSENYGKTPFAWQVALKRLKEQGENYATGYTCIPLPVSNILDDRNRWSPFIYINKGTDGICIMELGKHLNAIRTNKK